jgi:hypothetical protein
MSGTEKSRLTSYFPNTLFHETVVCEALLADQGISVGGGGAAVVLVSEN